jgi:hypothetical protein
MHPPALLLRDQDSRRIPGSGLLHLALGKSSASDKCLPSIEFIFAGGPSAGHSQQILSLLIGPGRHGAAGRPDFAPLAGPSGGVNRIDGRQKLLASFGIQYTSGIGGRTGKAFRSESMNFGANKCASICLSRGENSRVTHQSPPLGEAAWEAFSTGTTRAKSHGSNHPEVPKAWCGRGDSNPHGLATVSPSSWCVCQFRHFRTWGALALSSQRSAFSLAEGFVLLNADRCLSISSPAQAEPERTWREPSP